MKALAPCLVPDPRLLYTPSTVSEPRRTRSGGMDVVWDRLLQGMIVRAPTASPTRSFTLPNHLPTKPLRSSC